MPKFLLKIMIVNTFLKITKQLAKLPGVGFLFGDDKDKDPGDFKENVKIVKDGSNVGTALGAASTVAGVFADEDGGGFLGGIPEGSPASI